MRNNQSRCTQKLSYNVNKEIGTIHNIGLTFTYFILLSKKIVQDNSRATHLSQLGQHSSFWQTNVPA